MEEWRRLSVKNAHRHAKTVYRTYVLVLVLSVSGAAYADPSHGSPSGLSVLAGQSNKELHFVGERFARTELFFGSSRPNAPAVTEEEFQQFLDDVITPRFPDGLTLLVGLGQFRGASGEIIRVLPATVLDIQPV